MNLGSGIIVTVVTGKFDCIFTASKMNAAVTCETFPVRSGTSGECHTIEKLLSGFLESWKSVSTTVPFFKVYQKNILGFCIESRLVPVTLNLRPPPQYSFSGSMAMIVGSAVNIKLPLGPTGLKPSKVIIASVLLLKDLLLLLFKAGLMIHGTFVFVTLFLSTKRCRPAT